MTNTIKNFVQEQLPQSQDLIFFDMEKTSIVIKKQYELLTDAITHLYTHSQYPTDRVNAKDAIDWAYNRAKDSELWDKILVVSWLVKGVYTLKETISIKPEFRGLTTTEKAITELRKLYVQLFESAIQYHVSKSNIRAAMSNGFKAASMNRRGH